MKRLFLLAAAALPLLAAVNGFAASAPAEMVPAAGLTTAWAPAPPSPFHPDMAREPMEPVPRFEARPVPIQAQVLGVRWLNPLQRRDYPTEWQLLWTLGLARPNADDELAKARPGNFGSLQYVAPIVSVAEGDIPFESFHQPTLEQLTQGFRDRYLSDPGFLYSAASGDKRRWREGEGLHVQYALPAERLAPGEAKAAAGRHLANIFKPHPSRAQGKTSRVAAPQVHVTLGDANAGFLSLALALEYLHENPQATAWVLSWDAPGLPQRESIDQNMVLLVLAGPHLETGRAPLAWIGYPSLNRYRPLNGGLGVELMAERWEYAGQRAAGYAGVNARDLAYVVHDAANRTPDDHQFGFLTPSGRHHALAQGMRRLTPGFDFLRQAFNTPAALGDMGAASALTNVALGIAHANHFGKPVLVAGTTSADISAAVVVVPPRQARPIDPEQGWFRARGERDAYLPWWGLRHDAPAYPQGYSQ